MQEERKERCRIISRTACNNKATYRLKKDDGKEFFVCDTHLKYWVHEHPVINKITKTYGGVVEVLDLKKNNVIYKERSTTPELNTQGRDESREAVRNAQVD